MKKRIRKWLQKFIKEILYDPPEKLSLPDPIIACPSCGELWDLRQFGFTDLYREVTMSCTCKEQLDMKPDGLYGWSRPAIQIRKVC